MPEHHATPQPSWSPKTLLRPCKCGAPMLLMSTMPHPCGAGFIIKLYECFVCKKTDEIMTSAMQDGG